MSERAPKLWGPISFELSVEEARLAAARAGWRASLSGRLSRHHVAPLVAFSLLVAFVAILTFTGLIGRRAGEAALILAAIAFMASRMTAHWRLRGAQKKSLAAALALQSGGAATAWLDDGGLRLESAAGTRRLGFGDCEAAEEAGGVLYLWPRRGEPALLPARAFANEQAAREFIVYVRSKLSGRP